ncbi:helix-turn-helix domain-containing protein [Actinokineospora iranica]|uniref:NACHT domain-containing protein n=1 Tax=Actinokineospora iranica TaxID=1271860 RepID=A0A1G6JZG0_9PSEU|nr:helix-turn-helix transcriptional regulator [Actinokineospora iranica]SDC24189.1 NACHT domain-containing protein [Actinokineospora iranica]
MTSQFGAMVRGLRLRAGLTQEDLADRSGLGVRTVRGLETGERADPRVATVRRLADALGLAGDERVALFATAGFGKPSGPVKAAVAQDPLLAEVPGQDAPTEESGHGGESGTSRRDRHGAWVEASGRGLGDGAEKTDAEARPGGSAVERRLADAADELAHAVRVRWQREEEQRQIHDPFPLPVRWRPVAAALTDSWANVRRARDGAAEPLDLTGCLDQIVEVYRRIPSGRLVVLGQAGSGKTILTLRFVLDLLRTRAPGAAVPVVVGLGSWNPTTTSLRDWLIARLRQDHPDLDAPGPGGSTLAAALVETDRVLPVLDGFDEIADGLHRAALEALNATRLPLLLTSRPDEYAAAVAGTDVLTAACGVELVDLTPADLADYLPRTTRAGDGGGTAWEPVLTELRDRPDRRASANLAAALTTPLMVGLARAVYSDTPDHDPATLLDTDRFPTREALEEHLLGNFVATVYRHQPENARFDPDRVQRWLGHLARHLRGLGTYDLAWWQLGASLRLPVRMLVVALTAGLILGLVDLAVEGLLVPAAGMYPLLFGALFGAVVGSAFGVAYGLANRSGRPEPSRVRLRVRAGPARTGRVGSRFRIGFVVGGLLGFGYGLAREAAHQLSFGYGKGLLSATVDGVVFGLVFGVAAGAVAAVIARCEAPLDVKSAGGPTELLRANRTTVLIQLAVAGPAFALAVPLVTWLVVLLLRWLFPGGMLAGLEFSWSPVFGVVLGLVGGLVAGLGYLLSMTAWGQWLVFARLCLPLAGRLPWAVSAFLDDAYRRGVLRRAGAVYQFRHARLQDHLACR